MSPDWRDAVHQALRLQQYPELAENFKRSPLPEGMSALIRLVSDQGGGSKDLAASLNINEASLKLAASDYLQVICFYSGSSDVRVLGLNAGASLKLAKEHHRLLLKWLHPDRNFDNKAFAERVNQAWSAFKSNSDESLPADHLHGAPVLDLPASKPTSGRFPFFLTGLSVGVCFLLLLSVLPDNNIYVSETDISDSHNNVQENEQSVQANLQSLKASLQGVVTQVLPNKKPAAVSSAMDNKAIKKAQTKNPQPAIVHTNEPAGKARSTTLPTETKNIAYIQNRVVADKAFSETAVVREALPQNNAAVKQTENTDSMYAAQMLTQDFQRYYQQGNSKLFMRLFSADARNNRGGRDELEQDYTKLFEGSVQRKISFSHIRWQQSNAMLSFDARYSANVKRPGDLFSSGYKGRIKLVFVQQNEQVLIQQILLDN